MATGTFVNGHMQVTTDNVDAMIEAVTALTKNTVLVGVPDTTAGRNDGDITNAGLAYTHEFGSPARNIPARPFLFPGIAAARDGMSPHLQRAAQRALAGDKDGAMQAMHRVGIIAANGVRRKITTGPFEPLADRTVKARMSNKNGRAAGARKGAAKEMANRAAGFGPYEDVARAAAGIAASNDLVRPLIDTGQMRRSVTYVLRGKWF